MYAFSDGSPVYELLVAVTMIFACVLIAAVKPIARALGCLAAGLVTCRVSSRFVPELDYR
jgi:hypothetical protein